jgi:hypothetical protein
VHFVLTREYWPYDKWFGSAYRRLPGSETVRPHIDAALDASDFTTREKALVGVHESIAALHNASGTTDPVDPTVRPFYSRPYRVLDADRLVRACLARVDDPWLRALPLSGSIDQCVDSVDVLEHADVASVMRALYGEPE